MIFYIFGEDDYANMAILVSGVLPQISLLRLSIPGDSEPSFRKHRFFRENPFLNKVQFR